IRLSVTRKTGGFYRPSTNETDILLEASPLPTSGFSLNEKGLSIGICDKVKRQQHRLSNFKTSNCLIPVLASAWSSEHGFDDCIVLNDSNRLAEASSANVFLVNGDGRMMTPALEEGCVAGTMRETIIEVLAANGYQLSEGQIEVADLKKAKEVFFTNAINGIKWASNLSEKEYSNETAFQLMELLKKAKK
ncbi:MAG: aminotransferase class IV, partial [Bacteroidetes bacterium]|nr:aminotransferase class IV [Bacteroidota bacterium]